MDILAKNKRTINQLFETKLNQLIENAFQEMMKDGKVKHFLERRHVLKNKKQHIDYYEPYVKMPKTPHISYLSYCLNFDHYLLRNYIDEIAKKLSFSGKRKREMSKLKEQILLTLKTKLIDINKDENKIVFTSTIINKKKRPVNTVFYDKITSKELFDLYLDYEEKQGNDYLRSKFVDFNKKGRKIGSIAFTLSPYILDKQNKNDWFFKAKIQEDYYQWINFFEASHSKYGKIFGDFEIGIHYPKENKEALNNFLEKTFQYLNLWDYMDI